jgi:hypothetical protein
MEILWGFEDEERCGIERKEREEHKMMMIGNGRIK